jgi:hypothetical protein
MSFRMGAKFNSGAPDAPSFHGVDQRMVDLEGISVAARWPKVFTPVRHGRFIDLGDSDD